MLTWPILFSLIFALATGCSDDDAKLSCGDGTVEQDGECVVTAEADADADADADEGTDDSDADGTDPGVPKRSQPYALWMPKGAPPPTTQKIPMARWAYSGRLPAPTVGPPS